MSSFPFNQEQTDSPQGQPGDQPTDSAFGQQPQHASMYQPQVATDYPDIDVVDAGDEIIVYADLPGYDPEEVGVRINQQTLVIEAERDTQVEEDDMVILTERSTAVERVVTLPTVVRAGGAEAKLTNGVCMISLPKTTTDQYESITVTSE